MLVDIDGVLADASGRQHYLNNPEGRRDWRGFFGAVGDDPPLVGVPELLRLLDPSVTVILLSARPAWVFDITRQWLERHDVHWHLLVLRGDDAVLGAPEFKCSVLGHLRESGFTIELALDDDQRIVEMYRQEGCGAVYVHSGYYGGSAAHAPR